MHVLINTPKAGLVAVAAVLLGIALLDGGAGPVAVGAISAVGGLASIVAVLAARPRGGAPPVEGLLAAAALLGLAALTALSLQWASDDGAGFRDLALALGYSSAFILVLLLAKPGSGADWLRALGLAALAICAISLAARLFDLGSWDSTIGAALPAADDRLSGPLGYWNALGSLAALTIPLLLWQATAASSLPGRRVALAAIALPMVVIMLTASRGAVLAALLGVAVCVGYSLKRRRTLGLAAIAATAGALVCVFVAVIDDGGGGRELPLEAPMVVPAGPGAELDVGLARGSDSGRGEFWETALAAFRSDPLRGVGAGGFSDYWNRHGALGVPIENAHSAPLEALAELGVLGGILVVGFLALVVFAGHARALEERREQDHPEERGIGPAAAALAVVLAGSVGFLFDWTNEIPAAFLPVLVAAALLSGSAFLRPGRSAASVAGWPGGAPTSVIAALLGGTAAVWAGTVLAVSSHSLEESRTALAEGRLADAARLARPAIEMQPWAAEPRLVLAEIELGAENLDAALRQAREAVRLAPDDFQTWRLVSLVSGELGVEDAAEAYSATAERLAPRVLARSGQTP